MRCKACNVSLTDFETSRKSALSGDYLDLCNECLHFIRDDVQTQENFLAYVLGEDDLDTLIEERNYGPGVPADADEFPEDE